MRYARAPAHIRWAGAPGRAAGGGRGRMTRWVARLGTRVAATCIASRCLLTAAVSPVSPTPQRLVGAEDEVTSAGRRLRLATAVRGKRWHHGGSSPGCASNQPLPSCSVTVPDSTPALLPALPAPRTSAATARISGGNRGGPTFTSIANRWTRWSWRRGAAPRATAAFGPQTSAGRCGTPARRRSSHR